MFYVLLALVGSELLEDYSIMRQCAIGGEQIRQNICNKNHKYCAKTAKLYEIILMIFLTGFSGVLFALKVVNSYHSHRSISNVMMLIMSACATLG